MKRPAPLVRPGAWARARRYGAVSSSPPPKPYHLGVYFKVNITLRGSP